ncbi:glucose dehydrogenase [Methanocella sp. CWC-04]|uniref:Glucose 1-dehydrogenase n=1 Tax=Methanooceanicella nereidis TaxID=2052831 RepID=A0AAP2REM9_9EURY|nr:glucose 1-dehydrogenase [Methanocella sp. CWC-04]MCD1295953.1 glucose dehydrogenase [Methanocella sp. CWC-04]
MKAAVVTPGQKDSIRVIDIETPGIGDDEVLVKVSSVGVDGTDEDINDGKYGKPPEGCDHLIIGHEAVGEVEKTGNNVRCLEHGDIVVPMVRRPCWENCYNCRNHQPDMCLTGDYFERGIKGLHGFMSGYFSEWLEYLIRLPPELKSTGVLLEPLSVAEKGIREALSVQGRMLWNPGRALVLGAGSLGLLATFILRDMGIDTYTVATRDKKSIKAQVAEQSGAKYINANEEPIDTLPDNYGDFDIIIEATGVSRLAFQSISLVNTNGVVCLLGLYPSGKKHEVCTDCIGMDIVMGNKLVFGSVSSNRIDFERGVDRLISIKNKWPGMMEKMFTRSVAIDNAAESLIRGSEDIKVLVNMPV